MSGAAATRFQCREFFRISVTLVCMLVVIGFSERAHGAMYWANGNAIAGANIDGSNADLSYIGGVETPGISRACGVAVDSTYIYWADMGGNRIGRANLDGTEPVFSFISGADWPCGVTVDSTYIYWANVGGDSIGRAKLDGTNPDQRFVTGMKQPCGVAVTNFFIYWGSPWEHSIGRALVSNGGVPHNQFIKEANSACGVAIDESHIYWGSFGSSIGRADYNGENPSSVLIGGLDRPCGVAVNASQVFWTEEALGSAGLVGTAGLNGLGANRSLVTNLNGPCGIALDNTSFPLDRSAHLPPSEFAFGRVKHNRRSRTPLTFFAVDVPQAGSYSLVTRRGLDWNFVGETLDEEGQFSSAGRKWFAVWPKDTRTGYRLGRRIRNRGHMRFSVAFSFTASDHNPTTKRKSFTLLKVRRQRH